MTALSKAGAINSKPPAGDENFEGIVSSGRLPFYGCLVRGLPETRDGDADVSL
jgi:hypothetical protein